MNKKNTAGFSYVEILVALAMFFIMLSAVLPSLLQAGRNMEFAESYYVGHLSAQEIMLVVRDAILDGDDPQSVAVCFAEERNISNYRVWIFGEDEHQFGSANVPAIDVTLESGLVSTGNNSVIIVAVWNSIGHLVGRAVGVAM